MSFASKLATIHEPKFAMDVPWQGTQCIVCLEPSEFTEEHVIPEALGGRLTCRFLCVACNSKLGHKIEGYAKADPTVRLLAAKLAERIPRLVNQLVEGQDYVLLGPGGSSRGRVKDGEFVVRSEKLADGSLVQATPHAAKSIQQMLKRANHDPAAIAQALSLFKLAPEDTRIALLETIEIVKWSIESIQPALDGPLMNPAVPLKIAYEFLALHLNTAIYQDAPTLAATRNALVGHPIDPVHLLVERLHAPEAKPFHGIHFEGNNPHATVQVRLFGQLAFRVHFKTLSVDGPRFVYTHDLAADEEYVAHSAASPAGG